MYSGRIGAPDRLGRCQPERSARVPAQGPARHWPGALRRQKGETDPSAKPLKGFAGGSVLEVVADHSGNTWRGVYTVRYSEAIYVLRFPEEIEEWYRHAEAGD